MADLSGTATKDDGTAIGGAKITAENQDTGEVSKTTTTNTDGTYTISGVSPMTAQVLIEYEENGTVYRDYANPYVTVESQFVGDPTSFWGFDEGSGTTLNDSLGSFDGTINGATWQTGAGYGDTYLQFDGTDDDVALGSWIHPNTNGAYTQVCWAAPADPLGPSQTIFGPYSQARLHKSGSGDEIYTRVNQNPTPTIVPTDVITADTWYMLAVTRDASGNITTYRDNVGVVATATEDHTFSEASIAFGSDAAGSKFYNGAIDYTLLYDYELTEQEILDIYNDTSGNYPGH